MVKSNTDYEVCSKRYRPMSFDDLVGQEQVAQALKNAIERNRVGHAYLFTGARGVGKTSCARVFAKALNCVQGPTDQPCHECDICQAVYVGSDIDVIEIDGASNRGIEEIRQLRANVAVHPSRARYKIYIIDEVHMLTIPAFNALLKTLEEPPPHVKFLFCTTDPEKIPITVISRCQRFDFPPVRTPQILHSLTEIVRKEGRTADPEALNLVARRAAGSMRDSQSLLEQLLSFSSEEITLEHVHKLLGTADSSRLVDLVASVAERNAGQALAQLDEAALEGVDVGQLIDQLMGYCRDMLAALVGCDAELMLHTRADAFETTRQQAEAIGQPALMAAAQILDQTLTKMRQSVQSRTLAELALIRICQLEDLDGLADLIREMRHGRTPSKSDSKQANPGGVRLPPDSKKNDPVAEAIPTPPSEPVSPPAPTSPVRAETEASGPPPSTAGPSPPTAAQDPPASLEKAEPTDAGATESQATARATIEFAEKNLTRFWQEALAEVGGMTADYARATKRLAISAPNRLVVTFAAEYTHQRNALDRADRKLRLEQACSDLAGQSIKLEFLCEEKKQPTAVETTEFAAPKPRPERDPFVQEAIDVFGAEITGVETPKRR